MPIKSPFDIPKLQLELQNLAFVALGSNLDDPKQNVLRAMNRLQGTSDFPLLCSSCWQSTPVDCPADSPAFVNAVVGLLPRANETSESLFDNLQTLEKEFGSALWHGLPHRRAQYSIPRSPKHAARLLNQRKGCFACRNRGLPRYLPHGRMSQLC